MQYLTPGAFLVVGRAGMDLYPDPPGTSIEGGQHFRAELGGSAANIAVALCRQGAQASLLSCLSDDAVGRFCRAQLHAYGVGADTVRVVGGEYRSSLALSESRVQSHQTVIYRNGAADFQMSLADVEAVDFSAYTTLVITGTALAAEPSRAAILMALQRAEQAGLTRVFDIDYRPYSWASEAEAASVYTQAAEHCEIIIGNDVEFGCMAGDYANGPVQAQALAQAPSSADQPRLVVFKRGEHGAVTYTPEETLHTGIYPVEALKPVGAGDSFMGGFLVALAQGRSVQESVLRGSACASMVVSRVGCAPAMPSEAELDTFLSERATPSVSFT